jgi:hypothetical protein
VIVLSKECEHLQTMTNRRILLATFFLLVLAPQRAALGQGNNEFDVTLQVDYSPAQQMLDFFDRQIFDVGRVANNRGNKIAAATSLLLARTARPPNDFADQLGLIRDDVNTTDDIYGLKDTRLHTAQLRKLLTELRKRQLDRRVIATVQAYFPPDANISCTIPVYVVAMGNEKAAAFVRWVVWKNDTPVFVNENHGDQVIVLNIDRMLAVSSQVDAQFIQLLGTLAHECFHAIFGVYQRGSETWKAFHERTEPIWRLEELVQNEGIAYLLSMQLQIGGQTPPTPWFEATGRAISTLNAVAKELLSPSMQGARARDLILNANMSGSFEGNYGATAGLRMAYEIDTRLGRPALVETISNGPRAFFGKYDTLCLQNSTLPRLDDAVMKVLEQ